MNPLVLSPRRAAATIRQAPLASGNSDPMRAYFKGQVGVAGDIIVAAKLASL